MVNRGYYDLKTRDRSVKPTYYFMLNCLLYSKVETGLTSETEPDEDVNVYLAHLLNSFINPDYVDEAKKYLSKYDTEVFTRLANSTDARLKYRIYKTNADFLLVSIGIFDNPTALCTKPAQAPHHEEAYIGRGKTYYHFAYTFSQVVNKKNPAISDVLEKLSVGFERYMKVLSHMRGEYMNLLDRLSKGKLYQLERSVNEEEKKEVIREKQNRLLDLYSEWKKTHSFQVEKQMHLVADEIKEMNPKFSFSLPEA